MIVCYDLPVIMRVQPIWLALPLSVLVLSCSQEPAQLEATRTPDEAAAIQALKEVNRAQADFIRRTRRYPQSFNELIAEHLLNTEPTEEQTGYRFSLAPSPDAVSYTLKATPASPGARHFFTDQTGVIRSELDKPATAESPEVPD
jgi:hypothetical protein